MIDELKKIIIKKWELIDKNYKGFPKMEHNQIVIISKPERYGDKK